MNLDEIYEDVINTGAFCNDCEYSKFYFETHPYGSGTAREELWHCTVDTPQDCPGVIEYLEDL